MAHAAGPAPAHAPLPHGMAIRVQQVQPGLLTVTHPVTGQPVTYRITQLRVENLSSRSDNPDKWDEVDFSTDPQAADFMAKAAEQLIDYLARTHGTETGEKFSISYTRNQKKEGFWRRRYVWKYENLKFTTTNAAGQERSVSVDLEQYVADTRRVAGRHFIPITGAAKHAEDKADARKRQQPAHHQAAPHAKRHAPHAPHPRGAAPAGLAAPVPVGFPPGVVRSVEGISNQFTSRTSPHACTGIAAAFLSASLETPGVVRGRELPTTDALDTAIVEGKRLYRGAIRAERELQAHALDPFLSAGELFEAGMRELRRAEPRLLRDSDLTMVEPFTYSAAVSEENFRAAITLMAMVESRGVGSPSVGAILTHGGASYALQLNRRPNGSIANILVFDSHGTSIGENRRSPAYCYEFSGPHPTSDAAAFLATLCPPGDREASRVFNITYVVKP